MQTATTKAERKRIISKDHFLPHFTHPRSFLAHSKKPDLNPRRLKGAVPACQGQVSRITSLSCQSPGTQGVQGAQASSLANSKITTHPGIGACWGTAEAQDR